MHKVQLQQLNKKNVIVIVKWKTYYIVISGSIHGCLCEKKNQSMFWNFHFSLFYIQFKICIYVIG